MSESLPHPTSSGQMEAMSNLPVPIEMKLFAAWETRRIPSNCVSRTCTLTLSHLAVFEQVEPGLNFIVISVSMKTPRRLLRSNEISLPLSGVVDIPLKLTFTHQYPHFLKRNGNELQIRLQRRKRTIRGYKTLAEGSITMNTVLQRNIINEVLPLYCTLSGKYNFQHVADITIESLTSTPSEMSSRSQTTVEGDNWSEEEDEELVFEEVVERNLSEAEAYDSSAENERDMFPTQRHRSLKLPWFRQPQRTVMSLLRRKSRKAQGHGDLDMSQEEVSAEEGDLQFVSDISDSNSDEDDDDPPEGSKHSTPRPQLRPLYTAEITSMTSLFSSSRRGSVLSISSATQAQSPQTSINNQPTNKTLGTSV